MCEGYVEENQGHDGKDRHKIAISEHFCERTAIACGGGIVHQLPLNKTLTQYNHDFMANHTAHLIIPLLCNLCLCPATPWTHFQLLTEA